MYLRSPLLPARDFYSPTQCSRPFLHAQNPQSLTIVTIERLRFRNAYPIIFYGQAQFIR